MKNMRQIKTLILSFFFASAYALQAIAADVATFEQSKPLKIALVNFKTCVEKSKVGQKEQVGFDGMKKQMETIMIEKEKTLSDVSAKFNDMDYLDSLSPEAEADLKHKYRSLSQEYQQQQNQFYQTLSQANVAIVQKLTQDVTKACEKAAKTHGIDLIINEEAAFYNTSAVDISQIIIKIMDETFTNDNSEKEQAAAAPAPTPAVDVKK